MDSVLRSGFSEDSDFRFVLDLPLRQEDFGFLEKRKVGGPYRISSTDSGDVLEFRKVQSPGLESEHWPKNQGSA